MNYHQIKILYAQSTQHALNCSPRLPLLSRCDFASNKNFTAVHTHLFEHLPNYILVSVYGGSVDVGVTCLQRPSHAFFAIFTSQLVGTVADLWDFSPCVEFHFGIGLHSDHLGYNNYYSICNNHAGQLLEFLSSAGQKHPAQNTKTHHLSAL